jgi:hypothetical protein
LELLFSEDLQEDTFNEDHNSLFSGDADNLSLEFVPAAGGAEAHFLLKRIGNDNVLVKVETDATAFNAALVTGRLFVIRIWLKHAQPARRLGLVQQIKPSSECYQQD